MAGDKQRMNAMFQAQNRLETIFRHLKPNLNNNGDGITWNNTEAISTKNSFIPYRYTLENDLLTPLQRNFYEDNGYLVIKKLVPDHLLDQFRQRFIDICEKRVVIPGLTIMKDVSLKDTSLRGQDVINKLQDFVFDDELFQYCCIPQVVEYARCFTGPNMMAMHTMLINKPPDRGTLTSRHPLHQDLNYFPFRPADRIVCSWTAMEKVNRQNGCLVAIPGSHKGELLLHGYPEWEGGVNKMYHGIRQFSQSLPRTYLEMEKGDTVFFHPILIHGSGANKTDGYRKAISCHFAASECEYVNVKGTIQEEIAGEILKVAERRGITLNDYADIWRARSRVVRGERINL